MIGDVVIIGGGIVGAATAYELARRGVGVVLLEATRLGDGATGRNLGYVWVHTRRPGPELDLVMDTRRRLPLLGDELDATFDLRLNGGISFYSDERQAPAIREFVERRTAEGVDMRLLDGDDARALAPILPETVLGATFCPLDAQIDSRKLVRAFALAAQRHGARVLEGATVRGIRTSRGRVVGVDADAGRFDAGEVVLATGAWSPPVARPLGVDLPIHPMRLQVLQTEPLPPQLDHLLYGAAALKQYAIFRELPSFRVEDFRTRAEEEFGQALLTSACQRADGSFLLGCAMDYPGLEWHPDLSGVAMVAGALQSELPALRGARFARAWAGILPFTADNLPIIDRAPGLPGLFVAAGHVFGNGAGPTTGRIVAAMLCGEEPVIDPAPFAFGRSSLDAPGVESTW